MVFPRPTMRWLAWTSVWGRLPGLAWIENVSYQGLGHLGTIQDTSKLCFIRRRFWISGLDLSGNDLEIKSHQQFVITSFPSAVGWNYLVLLLLTRW